MLPVVWTPEANEDLLEARAWYDNIRQELGERFALAVEATVEALAEHPLQFPVVYRSRRRAGVRRFPYGIFFESDCGDSLLPRRAQSEALAIPLSEIINR
jgi:plasmid stabilization system protein ParE